MVRTPDRWRIRERRLALIWTAGHPAVAGRGFPLTVRPGLRYGPASIAIWGSGRMPYEWDVFLSYRRSNDWPRFVERQFFPKLKHWL
ncbi:MAG TPA: hypothetical protein VJ371_12835, partial [Streptosporangiaceae bacterium]|nr:hypothetical protein [Streptosporangiaceae bacterium]